MTEPMMACGHRANGVDQEGKPVCVICACIAEGYDKPVAEPDLNGRKCKCLDCGKTVPSTEAVAFFEYRPKEKFDLHYDGCRGWN